MHLVQLADNTIYIIFGLHSIEDDKGRHKSLWFWNSIGFCVYMRSSVLKMLFSLILFWLNFFNLQDYNVMFAEVFITYSLKKKFTWLQISLW